MNNKDLGSQPYRMTTTDGSQRPEDDFFDKEAAYDAWEEQTGSIGGGMRRFWLLVAILIVALIGIYIIYQAIRPRENPVRLTQSKVVDSRIDELELRLTRIEDSIGNLDMATPPDDQVEILDQLSGRIDRLEGSFQKWVEEATAAKQVAKDKKTVAAKPKKPSAPAKKQTVTKQPAATKPQKKTVSKAAKKPSPLPPSGEVRYHTVQPEENLYRISIKYNLSVDKIKELNNLSNNTIKTGQKLRISP